MVVDRYRDGYPEFHELIRAHTWKILHEANDLQLHSLNPFRRAVGRAQLQGIAVEHSVELESGPDREALLAMLFHDVAMGFGAPCFRPEHAITATLGSQRVELLLDYACGRVVLIQPAGQPLVAGKLRDSGRERLEQLLGAKGALAP